MLLPNVCSTLMHLSPESPSHRNMKILNLNSHDMRKTEIELL